MWRTCSRLHLVPRMWHPLAKPASAAARSVGPSAEQVLVEPRQVLVAPRRLLGASCGVFTAAGAPFPLVRVGKEGHEDPGAHARLLALLASRGFALKPDGLIDPRANDQGLLDDNGDDSGDNGDDNGEGSGDDNGDDAHLGAVGGHGADHGPAAG